MNTLISMTLDLHDDFFSLLNKITKGWFIGLAARFVFTSVLFFYFFNSAQLKTGDGWFAISDGAYYQIIPTVFEAMGHDPDAVAFFPWKAIIYLGTFAEFLLPVLIVIGLFTRLASMAMIGFIFVQSGVDIYGHDIGTIAGSMFDYYSDGLIWDQRLLWVFMLIIIALKGAGYISLDHVLARIFKSSRLNSDPIVSKHAKPYNRACAIIR